MSVESGTVGFVKLANGTALRLRSDGTGQRGLTIPQVGFGGQMGGVNADGLEGAEVCGHLTRQNNDSGADLLSFLIDFAAKCVMAPCWCLSAGPFSG